MLMKSIEIVMKSIEMGLKWSYHYELKSKV